MDYELMISSGTVDITPEQPLMLAGYNNRTAPFKAIADRLEANALVIHDGTSRVVIISIDLLYPGDALRKELLNALDLSENELFLCASHTHYAPMTASSMPRLGIADPGYVRFVAKKIASLIGAVQGKQMACFATYHEGTVNHSLNRRLRCLRLTSGGLSRGVGMGPNRDGQRDENVRILKFSTAAGETLALAWNYACHASDAVDRLKVSAAYPGVVRSHLRSVLGPVPILFLQGFSGDVRPPFTGISDGIKGLARRALLGPQFKITPHKAEWQAWSNSLAASVASFAQSPALRLKVRAPLVKRIEVPEHEFALGGDGNKSLIWHLIDCAGFRILGINAEPVVEYRRLVARSLGDAPLLTAGCLDQTHCYLPSNEMIAESGYEVEGFRRLLNFKGSFRSNLQEPIIGKLTEAASPAALGRTV